jgi:hypothetical protein
MPLFVLMCNLQTYKGRRFIDSVRVAAHKKGVCTYKLVNFRKSKKLDPCIGKLL